MLLLLRWTFICKVNDKVTKRLLFWDNIKEQLQQQLRWLGQSCHSSTIMHLNILKVCMVGNLRVFLSGWPECVLLPSAPLRIEILGVYTPSCSVRDADFIRDVILSLFNRVSDVRLAGCLEYLALLHIMCLSDCRSTGRLTSGAKIWGYYHLWTCGWKNHTLKPWISWVQDHPGLLKNQTQILILISYFDRRTEARGYWLFLDIYLWLGHGCIIFSY